ncbi:MAG: AAA family ATPase [Anaerostipes hadrus]|nr:AAA family ATPase [Anaerostipes hadrus]
MEDYKIPIGISDFEEIRQNGYYYIDKTGLVEEILKTPATKVTLITRPRRFGKTLGMSMLANFFDIEKDSRSLFQGLEISKNKVLCEQWMNQYPTLFLSLKDISGNDFEDAYERLCFAIAEFCIEHSYLCESKKIEETYKEIFQKLKKSQGSKTDIQNSLWVLMKMMQIYYGKSVILLLDEYDVPIAKAQTNGYYKEMLDVVGAMLSKALKDNQALQFAYITGCLKISKESIFTGTNNFVSDTISGERFNEYFGFTKDEVDQLLKDTNFLNHSEQVRSWYDGYHFGKIDVYCPWDVLCYVNKLMFEPDAKPENFWENTSHNDIIREFLGRQEFDVTDKFEMLLSGKEIKVKVEENLTYDNLTASEENLWSVLYLTGYLTSSDIKNETKDSYTYLKIPNKEVKDIFKKSVLQWFNETTTESDRTRLFQIMWAGKEEELTNMISDLLFMTISYHDYEESFYHAFLTGLFSYAGYVVESNKENGLGRSDIVIKDKKNRRAVIFECKIAKTYDKMKEKCEEALQQIETMQYAKKIQMQGYREVIRYGICFWKKDCMVKISNE